MTPQAVAALRENIGSKLSEAERRGWAREARRLHQLALATDKLKTSLETIANEFHRITSAVENDVCQPTSIHAPLGLSAEVRWRTDMKPETISGVNAAATLRRFIERASEVLGAQCLELLASVETGRGPLISRQPMIDFKNRRSGTIYTHHPIGAQGWHVITHSSTDEKKEHLQRAGRALGEKHAIVTNFAGEPSAPPASAVIEPPDDGKI